ncbi:hypothetical protein NA57DRAFT_44487 [Rhizodiscina lignyota]|uniref:Archaemetzincin-2 n=1 Tax=Rhizodiscina lignyota TaxID=1504668 RepID=A0A9P4I7Y7_9PEZI|nr:hypothetical protein NA57DRAFT_44487 [Rhizodiscina lignyota]
MAPTSKSQKPCLHERLTFTASTHAAESGYKLRSTNELGDAAAFLKKGQAASKSRRDESKNSSPVLDYDWTFPAPLVLPDDDLALDPDYPPQSVEEWEDEEQRNKVTSRRRTVYVCAPPGISDEVGFMKDWTIPFPEAKDAVQSPPHPATQNIIDYLSAFYHGLPVEPLKQDLSFFAWDKNAKPSRLKKKQSAVPKYVGLGTSKDVTRIGVRVYDEAYEAQLNLNDILDVAVSFLPNDAYALVLLVEHDMYEHDEDDFCCGRAYGGSRVAVVSSARYNPTLDATERVDRAHAWPTSHCKSYVESKCNAAKPTKRPKKKAKIETSKTNSSKGGEKPLDSPLHDAVKAHSELQPQLSSPSPSDLTGLWLGRICKTASHELGHCFGIDHCVYYACIMQGTASLAEDARQPPYLCPIDQTKVLAATGVKVDKQYEALLKFCEARKQVELFAAFAAWLAARLDKGTGNVN